MTKREHLQLWHKKAGKEAGVNALAVRTSLKGGKLVGPQAKLTSAQNFMKELKGQIHQAVKVARTGEL